MSLQVSIRWDMDAFETIMMIPLHLRLEPAERILKAMAKPVVDKAKDLAPSSRSNRNRDKWGKKFKNNQAWQVDSGKHIAIKYLKNKYGGTMIIGGQHPKANKLNFNAGDKRIVKVWGRDPKSIPNVKIIDPKDRFVQRAYDETRDQQLSAGHAQLVKEIEELKIG